MKHFLFVLLLLTGVSCSKKKFINESAPFTSGEALIELDNKKLSEISGIASSINNPGFIWAHNDSGNDAEVFLIDTKLNIKLVLELKGIENRDWEDIAVGPGPESGKNYIYVAEIGDNEARYTYKHILRFEEPVAGSGKKITIDSFDTITFRLPQQRKDTECLLLDPITKDLYVISKREEPVFVYQIPYPYSTADTVTAKEVTSLPFTQIVGGDFSADGKEILLKNYQNVFYWSNPSGKPVAEVLKEKPQLLPYEEEPQGEAITWARDGSGFYTLSEMNPTEKTYLYFYKRK